MLLQMMCFFMLLLVVGGFGSLFVIFDPLAAHSATHPFACFFAGLMSFTLAILGGFVGEYVNNSVGAVITMLGAPTVGLFGGGIFGYRLGLLRDRRRPSEDS